jgi:hypothetical protein
MARKKGSNLSGMFNATARGALVLSQLAVLGSIGMLALSETSSSHAQQTLWSSPSSFLPLPDTLANAGLRCLAAAGVAGLLSGFAAAAAGAVRKSSPCDNS